MAETSFDIEVRFTSDWHIGMGSGRHGAVDRTIVTDTDGLPYVPAKTAVGILRDGAEIAAGALDGGTTGVWAEWVEALFGSQPALSAAAPRPPRPAALISAPLRMPDSDRAFFATAPNGESTRGVTRADLVRATTVIRTGVKIDAQTRTAEQDAFRIDERARAGITVVGTWTITHPDDHDIWPARLLLLAASKIVRGMGGKRRRGAGTATITVDGLGDLSEARARFDTGTPASPWPSAAAGRDEPTAAAVAPARLQHAHDLIITVKLPVVVDTGLWGNVVRTSTSIPAAMLLPIIRPALPGPSLADLVRTGRVVVTDATPQIAGARGLPWPRALTQSKDTDPNDQRYVNVTAWHRENPRLKPKATRYVSEGCRTWREVDIVEGVHAVIADAAQRPTSATGGLFVYEGIAPGTTLRASIFLPDGVELMTERIGDTHRIGRSNKDDYGLVGVRITEPDRSTATPAPIPTGTQFRVWATSDILLRNGRGGVDTSPDGFALTLGAALGVPGALTVVHADATQDPGVPFAQVRETALTGVARRQTWQRSWGLPRPSLTGIAAGSVFVCACTETIAGDDISRVHTEGVGGRTAEGFGRVLIDPAALNADTIEMDREEETATPGAHAAGAALVNEHILAAAWRAVITREASAVAAKTWQDYVPRGLTRAQLGNLRGVVDGLSARGGRNAAASWIARLRAGRSATKWGDDELQRVGRLLTYDPAAQGHPVWPLLFGHAPTDLGEQQEHLSVYAVQAFLTEVVRTAARKRGELMARLSFRYTLTGKLTAVSAVHVGGVGPDGTVDLGQVRDGLGRIVLPGTSLAGVMRAALSDDEAWWGTHLSGDATQDRNARASRITVVDAPAQPDVTLNVRDGVSIDRITGAAAHRHLFTRYVVPAGTPFDFELVVDVPRHDLDDAAHQRVREITALLCGPGITVGAAGTRGLGTMRLRHAHLRREDFTSAAGLFTALEAGGDAVDLPAIDEDAIPHGILRITVPWRPLGPVMSKVADETGCSDAFPAVLGDSDGIRLLIPGSSLKGTLRSHAERIVRTLQESPLTAEDFVEQMERGAALRGVGEIFGAAGNLARKEKGRRGLLSVSDITSRAAVPKEEWDRVQAGGAAADGTPGSRSDDRERAHQDFTRAVAALNRATATDGLWFDIASRNAIDRWTGAAADGLLFTAVEPYAVGPDPATAWSPLVLDVDIAHARRPNVSTVPVNTLLALMLLLLRDFAEGWIPIGFGTTRGLGAVRAEPDDITFTFNGDDSDNDCATALHGKTLRHVLDDATITDPIERAWREIAPCPVSTTAAD